MKYSIGIDVGVASVGYSVLELDSEDQPFRIIRLGTRIFDIAEHPKTGASLAVPRREARGMRRRLRRHRHRLERIRGLIVSQGLLGKDDLFHLYDTNVTDVYELRVKALDFVLSDEEFARVLIHIAQRRGFKSNKKSDKNDKENGKLLDAVSKNRELCIQKGYRTIGEMFFKDEQFADHKRNKGDSYLNTVSRDMVEDEVKLIFKSQRKLKNKFASVENENKYLEILLSQRSFAEGPGAGPYSGNQIERMLGNCTLEKSIGNIEPRAAKATYSFQIFSLWQHINNIKYNYNGETVKLSDEQRQSVFDAAHKSSELSYWKIRKTINLPDEAEFVGLDYDVKPKKKGKSEEKADDKDDSSARKENVEKSKKITDLKIYHEIRKCLDTVNKELFGELSNDQLDVIGESVSRNYSDGDVLIKLESAGISKEACEALLYLPNFPKYGHISVKACKKLIPFLSEGMTYDKACDAAGYNFKADDKKQNTYLPPLSADDANEITSPVVKRAVSQTIKVINAIIREMNASPVYLNVELARDLSKNLDKRNEIKAAQDQNAAQNEIVVERIRKELGITQPKGQDIVKFKLWQEQDGICPYSQERISIERLFEPGYVDVDHIVPYSRSFDDRMANKVLVLSSENRQKGDRLPLEYLTGEKRERFIVWIKSRNIKSSKRNLLLKEKISDENEFRQRNLQDTQFIASFLGRYISQNLDFAPSSTGMKRRVYALNGAITSYVRKRWGINKVRENGDSHHAVDATVIACITQAMVNNISRHSKHKETRYYDGYKVDKKTGEVIDEFPKPWKGFLKELDVRLLSDEKDMRKCLNDINPDSYELVDLDAVPAFFVSRMSNHKITGAAHLETVRSGKYFESCGKTVSKTDIKKLKLGKDGEIEGYFERESDTLLYNALKTRLAEFGGDGEKAFAEPFHKPKADGTDGPIVKKVKIEDTASLVVEVQDHKGVADNDKMVRVDVFHVENDGYYFVPVYVADTVKDKLPQKVRVRGKNPWKEMDDENFVFSLYKNDLIKVYSKKDIELKVVNDKSTLPQTKTVSGSEGLFLYFDGLDISTATFSGITHDNTYKKRGIGKTSLKIEKYEVDVLGNIRKIQSEKRQKFNLKKR